MSSKLGLAKFAEQVQPITPSRFLRSAPEAKEIIDGYRNGVSATIIYRWLVEERNYSPDQLPKPGSLAKHLYLYAKARRV